ncbi:hypothetical protein [Clostridium pasteurianum]|uniref:Uncharacterized protein n=1 Tax=Clostridium pasteurianum BC1 TaxID=86416 RepID=R4K4G4_CLOPA|nr:hypothetical protein [Clostridium pasteurianum]AGK98027.1 hypothetical protein Clopa_3217 [Clostridium pasteurianum BC1]
MITSSNIFIKSDDDYSFNPESKDTLILKCPETTWIIGSWDAFNKLFTAIDQVLHEEKETHSSLQDRLLESETKTDKLREENEYLREQLELRRQA